MERVYRGMDEIDWFLEAGLKKREMVGPKNTISKFGILFENILFLVFLRHEFEYVQFHFYCCS